MATVLIVEDDETLAGIMRRHLANAGHDVEWAADGDRGLKKVRFERPDVCVVDLMMPGTDGWGVIEQMRAEGIDIPVIVLSARSSEHDKVHTLGIGADDYLVKPASMRELVARVDAALRRSGRGTAAPLPERDEEAIESYNRAGDLYVDSNLAFDRDEDGLADEVRRAVPLLSTTFRV